MSEGVAGTDTEPLEESRRLLQAIRREEPFASHEERLAAIGEARLERLGSERATAFWLNVYNAATQLLLTRRPNLYDSKLRFFRADAITVAGTPLSVDQIEHGVLRDSAKYGLGYVPRVFQSAFERRHRLADLDPRIHFALNCGAVSCPPIAAYSKAVDGELDLAAAGYLDASVTYDPEAEVARVPRMCLWYRGDFGGPAGVRRLLTRYDVIPADAEVTIRYDSWDWSPDPAKFTDL